MNGLLLKIDRILRRKNREFRVKDLSRGIFHSILFHLLVAFLIQIVVLYSIPSTKRIRLIRSKSPIPVFLQNEIREEPKPSIGGAVKDTIEQKSESLYEQFAELEIDSTAINQKYEESTLNVSILFPINWIYFDNKVKNLIDGIIFMPGENSDYHPQISVLIQVMPDKSLFNRAYFDSSFRFNDMDFFIGPPLNTFGQVTQTIYVRTKIYKADFQIKCTSPSESEFKKFQPVFFAMVKSFSAG